jgi:parallel beta-helix repeat protein
LRNVLSGNGYSDQAGSNLANFGIGMVAAGSNDNLIEENSAVGNANGIFLAAPTTGNVIRGNVITGNPPIQVTNSIPDTTGVDIRNLSTAGANMFTNNLCVTALNAPCPGLPPAAMSLPMALGLTLDTVNIRAGGLFTATVSGNNLGDSTFFDLRFRRPGSTTDEVTMNWQQGLSARHSVAAGTATGNWIITGVRAHQDSSDQSGPFAPVSVTLSVLATLFPQ